MPLYEYNCNDCTNNFTELRSSSEMDNQIDCPECGCLETKRNISSFSVGQEVLETSNTCSTASSKFR